MAKQQYGVTGRKPPSPLLNLINAQTPYMRERKTLEENKQFRADEFSLMQEALTLQEEQGKKAAQIAETGLYVSAGLGLAQLASGGGTASKVMGGIKGVASAVSNIGATGAPAGTSMTAIGAGETAGKALTASGKWATAAKYG